MVIMPELRVTPNIVIAESELEESFILSSGAGGQNVNKVASAVQLRFDPVRAGLDDFARLRLLLLAGSRATKDGAVLMTGRRFRSQERNRADVRERLAELIRLATEVRKKRRVTRPSRASKEKRLEKKKTHSTLKRLRAKKYED
jgi:ribosome-associated protein